MMKSRRIKKIWVGAMTLLLAGSGLAQEFDPQWVLLSSSIREEFSPYVGNGYLGVTMPGGIFFPFPTDKVALRFVREWWKPYNEHFVNGLYNGTQLDPPKRARIPAWTNARLLVDGRLYDPRGDHPHYQQWLHLREGTFGARETWIVGDKVLDLEVLHFPARHEKFLFCTRYVFKPRFDGRLELSLALDSRFADDVEILHQAADAERKTLEVLCRTTRPEVETLPPDTLAEVQRVHVLPVGCAEEEFASSERIVKRTLRLDVKEGEVYVVTVFTGVVSSREVKDPLMVAHQVARQALEEGFDRVFQRHKEAWAELWESDIEIRGEVALQQVIRSALFYLLGSAREDLPYSISPMGISSNGYNGHIFWDAETWMYPALLLLYPQIAEAMLEYRLQTLPGAQQKAREYGYEGAMFPWESTRTGLEVTPEWSVTGEQEHHVVGDVGLAFWQYYLATGDEDWLREKGWAVLREIAKFWASRVTYNTEKDRYEIHKVMGPDEYHGNVNNSVYTNFIAKRNLEWAFQVGKKLGAPVSEKWQEIAQKIYLPCHEKWNIYWQFEGYRGDLIKQADVVLLFFPLGITNDEQTIYRNLSYYALRTDWRGPAMTHSIHAILAAQIGDRGTFNLFFRKSYEDNIHRPFYIWTETPRNKAANFLTGIGGFLQTLLYGVAGIRINEGNLTLRAMLPESIREMILHRIHFAGATYRIRIDSSERVHVERTSGFPRKPLVVREPHRPGSISGEGKP